MERLKQMKEMLMGCVSGQMSHLDSVDSKELGEAVDMIKDLSEAIYYCTITEAMKEKEDNTRYYPIMYYDDSRYNGGRMYYGGYERPRGLSSSANGTGTYHPSERDLGPIMRDHREGRSPVSRKMYIESKEMHQDKAMQMRELEKYVQELTSDMVEMIENASPEEKQFLSNKISTLATKIK